MKKNLFVLILLLYLHYSPILAQQVVLGHPIKSNSIAASKPHLVIEKFSERNTKQISSNPGISSRINPSSKAAASANETIIGTTTYDVQTNGTISNRLVNYNGHLSAVWNMSITGSNANGWPDRGTGYNYSSDGGLTWLPQPSARIEPFRIGFTNIAYSGNKECILAHTLTNGLAFTSRSNQGSGNWTYDSIYGTEGDTDRYCKMAAGGSDDHSFHSIWMHRYNAAVYYYGSLFYSKSIDDGATWSTPSEIFQYRSGIDVFQGIGPDAYSMDVRGNVIAIVAGDLTQDLVLLKSMDNGITWTKRIVDRFPVPLYDVTTMHTDTNNDGVTDTLFTNVGDQTVVIDNNNVVHVFFGKCRMFEDSGATSLSYFNTSSLYYWKDNWNDNSSQFLAGPPDLNGDGVISLPTGCGFISYNNPIGYYGTGVIAYIEMPSAGVDANNNLYVSYQAVDELSDTSLYGMSFMHPYVIKSIDGGNHWTDPDNAYDIVLAAQPDSAQHLDGVYASMAKTVDNKIHIIYQRDWVPGISLSAPQSCESDMNNDATNDIVYIGINPNNIPTATNDLSAVHSFSLSSNYPNPFHGKTSLNINLKKGCDVSVEVSDLLGRVLSVDKYSNLNSGSHILTIDASKFTSGVYTYKVKVGSDVMTKKMIVQ
jgi:hypothetical protein